MSAQSERQRLFDIAHAMGHTTPEVWEARNGKFFAACSCGWESTYRFDFVDALGAGVHHALSAAKPIAAKARRSGRPLGALIAAERRRLLTVVAGGKTPAIRDRFRRAA